MKITDWALKKQADLLKRIAKGERVLIGEYDGAIHCVDAHGTYMLTISGNLWMLNTERARNHGEPLTAKFIKSAIGEDADYHVAKKDGIAYSTGKELAVFTNSKCTVYVITKLLKEFPKDAQFFTSSPVSAVRIYYDNAFIGIVMPTRFAKEETT